VTRGPGFGPALPPENLPGVHSLPTQTDRSLSTPATRGGADQAQPSLSGCARACRSLQRPVFAMPTVQSLSPPGQPTLTLPDPGNVGRLHTWSAGEGTPGGYGSSTPLAGAVPATPGVLLPHTPHPTAGQSDVAPPHATAVLSDVGSPHPTAAQSDVGSPQPTVVECDVASPHTIPVQSDVGAGDASSQVDAPTAFEEVPVTPAHGPFVGAHPRVRTARRTWGARGVVSCACLCAGHCAAHAGRAGVPNVAVPIRARPLPSRQHAQAHVRLLRGRAPATRRSPARARRGTSTRWRGLPSSLAACVHECSPTVHDFLVHRSPAPRPHLGRGTRLRTRGKCTHLAAV